MSCILSIMNLNLSSNSGWWWKNSSPSSRWKNSEPHAAAYRFPRRARYLGRWILHCGWYPDYKIRLFDRRQGEWQGQYVHESVKVQGPVRAMDGEILHYTCDMFDEHRKRVEFYTDLAAHEMVERGESVGAARRIFVPPWVFFNTYFLRLGILDGYQGFLISRMAARYVRRKYAKWARLTAEGGRRGGRKAKASGG